MEYKVVEKFTSINGEGVRAGQLAVFIRFKGCNLNCSYCDTKWANEQDVPFTVMTEDEICRYIDETGIKNVTLTGGEPLIQPNIEALISRLCGSGRHIVEIETNGAADIAPVVKNAEKNLTLTMDYKLPSSGMERFMNLRNFEYLRGCDTVKFVSGTREDLLRAAEIIKKYDLTNRCAVYLSPVFGGIAPAEMVDFMLERNLNNVNLQLQLHKYIWDPNKRGV